MPQAFSQSKSVNGSSIGIYLTSLMGLEVGKKGLSKEPNYKKLLTKYQMEVTRKAEQDPDWADYADYIAVILDKSNQIHVYIDADEETVAEANLIEFGSGESPARPLLRTSEAQFNADFGWRKMLQK